MYVCMYNTRYVYIQYQVQYMIYVYTYSIRTWHDMYTYIQYKYSTWCAYIRTYVCMICYSIKHNTAAHTSLVVYAAIASAEQQWHKRWYNHLCKTRSIRISKAILLTHTGWHEEGKHNIPLLRWSHFIIQTHAEFVARRHSNFKS